MGERLRALLLERSEITAPAPRWRTILALLLSLAGLGVSTYLTVDHFAKVRLACSDAGIVNCQKVTTSAQSHILGIPVAVLGLAFYVVMTGLNLPVAWRSTDRRIHLARLVLMLAGICFVLYLVAAELLIIGNICLWCTSVHVITFVLLVVVLTTVPTMLGWSTAPLPAPVDPGRERRGAGGGAQPTPPGTARRTGKSGAGRTRGAPGSAAAAGGRGRR